MTTGSVAEVTRARRTFQTKSRRIFGEVRGGGGRGSVGAFDVPGTRRFGKVAFARPGGYVIVRAREHVAGNRVDCGGGERSIRWPGCIRASCVRARARGVRKTMQTPVAIYYSSNKDRAGTLGNIAGGNKLSPGAANAPLKCDS